MKCLLQKYIDEETITEGDIDASLRKVTLTSEFMPILCGAALRNRGIQPLIDAIVKISSFTNRRSRDRCY